MDNVTNSPIKCAVHLATQNLDAVRNTALPPGVLAQAALNIINSNPACVIFDIDGTLADGSHRSHHVRRVNEDGTKRKPNWTAYNATMEHDLLIAEVRLVLMGFFSRGIKIIICSGREAVHRATTEAWLAKHQIPYHELFMRPEKDYRSDDIIKEEILDLYILPNYTPLCVFDDRPRVIRAWKRRGLFVFNCDQSMYYEEF